jgi:hypothetical protein
MKKEIVLFLLMSILLIGLVSAQENANIFEKLWAKITGKSVSAESHSIGPSQDEQSCMMTCMRCTSPGVGCSGNQEECQNKCNMKKPEVTEETSCMETCVVNGCGEYDFDCQSKNQESCEKQCNMLGDKPDESTMSAEQLCITNCVEAEAPGTRCGNSQTGETGNELCQRCAQSCVHLYAGPCLNEEKLQVKKNECQTCEHCYGEPVMGPSGEGWDCIVDVKCGDASSQFGDEPGTGEGILSAVGNAIGNAFEGIADFFKGLFGGGEENQNQNSEQSSETIQPSA